jgi:hypothetical protein
MEPSMHTSYTTTEATCEMPHEREDQCHRTAASNYAANDAIFSEVGLEMGAGVGRHHLFSPRALYGKEDIF